MLWAIVRTIDALLQALPNRHDPSVVYTADTPHEGGLVRGAPELHLGVATVAERAVLFEDRIQIRI